MNRWRLNFVTILTISLLHLSNGSLSVGKHLPDEETCNLPCVDKIADSIFKQVSERYTALELRIIEKVELQLTHLERIIQERFTRIETFLSERVTTNVDVVHHQSYEESYHEVHKIEHNTTHHEVVKDLVVVSAENDTKSVPESIESSTPKPVKIDEIPSSTGSTLEHPDDCVHTDKEYPDYDDDYAQQFIEARMGPNGKRPCVEAGVTIKPSTLTSVPTEGSTTASSSSNKDNFVVGVEIVELPSYSQTVEVIPEVIPDESEAKETNTESVFQPSFDNGAIMTPKTTTERIATSTNDGPNQEIEQIVFIPDVEKPDTNKYGYELVKTTVAPKKKLQPWIRTSTAKSKLTSLTSSSTSTTTEDPNTYKIHFPTESPEPEPATTPKHGPIPKPPQVFRYARNYLNGTWTIIHSRYDGSISFNRSWAEYRAQFGRLPGEYWMGLEALHQLTKSGEYELLVLLKGFDGTVKTAMYDSFWVGSEAANYRLALGPFVGGDAGDSFSGASGQMFSTYDRDNDRSLCASCAEVLHSGWWFKDCADANLNGLYVSSMVHGEWSYGTSMNWWGFGRDYQGLKEAAMMVRKRGRKLA
ncbi:tenascin-R isoform X2 [Culex quinquefasciatus]|uniref:tenascin-R isoform X2 n=1 Tax=Culex quinquefasciatus TaxID=7176 RepID=UPI0018E3DE9D|nr:tenascin-R isoform X2 [Culex quinquefasciatus]